MGINPDHAFFGSLPFGFSSLRKTPLDEQSCHQPAHSVSAWARLQLGEEVEGEGGAAAGLPDAVRDEHRPCRGHAAAAAPRWTTAILWVGAVQFLFLFCKIITKPT